MAAGAEGAPAGAESQPREFRGRGPREGGRDRFRGRGPREGGEGGERGKREDRPPRKPKKPMRDAKTGAIVKMDEEDGRMRGGPKLPSKAKPMAFNPFANLGDLLKKKD